MIFLRDHNQVISFSRIEQRLSEMWTKSTTEIKEGLDEILSIQQPKALTDKRLRRMSRPHRPKDRITHSLGLEPVPSEEAEYEGSSLSGTGRGFFYFC